MAKRKKNKTDASVRSHAKRMTAEQSADKKLKSGKPIKATTIQRIRMWAVINKSGWILRVEYSPAEAESMTEWFNGTVEPVEVIRRVPCKLRRKK
jgi:hypothetical protein